MATLILDMDTEIQPYLDAEEASDDDKAMLEAAEARLIDMIHGETGRRFTEGNSGEVIRCDSTGTPRLWLPYRASAVTAVEVRASPSSDWEALDATDYELSSSGLALLRVDGLEWPDGLWLVRVTGTFGYEAADVPPRIKQLLLEGLNWVWRRGRKAFLSGDRQVMARLKAETNWDQILSGFKRPIYG